MASGQTVWCVMPSDPREASRLIVSAELVARLWETKVTYIHSAPHLTVWRRTLSRVPRIRGNRGSLLVIALCRSDLAFISGLALSLGRFDSVAAWIIDPPADEPTPPCVRHALDRVWVDDEEPLDTVARVAEISRSLSVSAPSLLHELRAAHASSGHQSPWPEECREVVFVVPRYPNLGGLTTAIEGAADALSTRGVPSRVISISPGDRPPRLPVDVVFAHPQLHERSLVRGRAGWYKKPWLLGMLVFKRIDRYRSLARYRRLISSLATDSAVVFTALETCFPLPARLLSARADGPLLLGQYHSSFESLEHSRWVPEALQEFYAGLDAFTTLTEEDAALFSTMLPNPCFALPNPVRQSGALAPSTEGRKRAVALARFSQEKQLDLAIRAFADVTKEHHKDWDFLLYGEGPEREHLQSLIQDLGVSDRVRILHRTDDVKAVLASASLNMLPSLYEGFPMSVLEASTMGVPTIAFVCSPGVRQLVDECSGFPVADQDEQAFRGSLAQALSDEGELVLKGAAARSVAARYSPQAIAGQWAEILGVCYARRRDRTAAGGGHKLSVATAP